MKKTMYLVLILLTIGLMIAPIEVSAATTYSKMVCGDMEIPAIAQKLVFSIITILKIATPVLIIIFGSVDLIKAVAAQKEDDIKKGWQTFIRRLLVGAIVFVVWFVVEAAIGIVAPHNENESMWDCVDCFVTGECDNLMIENTNND